MIENIYIMNNIFEIKKIIKILKNKKLYYKHEK